MSIKALLDPVKLMTTIRMLKVVTSNDFVLYLGLTFFLCDKFLENFNETPEGFFVLNTLL